MVSPLFLPKLQPRKNKAFNIFQAVLIVITYVSGFMFITEKMIILEYLLVLVACYLVIGFSVGLVQRGKGRELILRREEAREGFTITFKQELRRKAREL